MTFDGVPVETGSISFEPSGGKGRDFGGAIENGTYRITSPPGFEPGKWIVRIRASRKTGRQIPAGPPHPKGTMIDETVNVPPGYNERSTLTADLSAGTNRADFHMQSPRNP